MKNNAKTQKPEKIDAKTRVVCNEPKSLNFFIALHRLRLLIPWQRLEQPE